MEQWLPWMETRWRRRRSGCIPLVMCIMALSWTPTEQTITGQTNTQHGCDPGPDSHQCYFIIDKALNQSEAEAACASRAEGSHLAALTGGMALSHVSHMITSRHLTGAWIGGHYDISESEKGIRTLNNVECGYMAVTASKTATWRRIPCSDGRRFHCLYQAEGGPCRYEFTRCGKYCIRHVTTMFHAPKVDWYHAAQYCLSINAALPDVASHSDALEWVQDSKLCNFTSTTQIEVLNSWTNFTNLHWHWTTGEDMHFTKWLSGSPQPHKGSCVQLAIGSHLINVGFKSENCSTTLPAICQMSTSGQQPYPDLWAQTYHQHHHHHAHRRESPQMPTNKQPEQGHVTPSAGHGTPRPDHVTPSPNTNRRTERPPKPDSRRTTSNPTPYPTPHPTTPSTTPSTTTSMDSGEDGDSGVEGSGGNGGQGVPPDNKPRPPTTLPPPSTPPQTLAPPMQWSQALVVGLVTGGVTILLLILLIVGAICCCCRRSLPGCKPDKATDSESAPVRPPSRETQTPNNYNSLSHSREAPQEPSPDTYSGLDRGRGGRQNGSLNSHQYTQLQDSPSRVARYHETPQDKYYEIASDDVNSYVGRGRGRGDYPELPPRGHRNNMATLSMADRRLPSIPGVELDQIGSERTGSSPNYATRSGADEEWEYLEVIAPPNEERPSRQPSSASQRSQDSGIDLK